MYSSWYIMKLSKLRRVYFARAANSQNKPVLALLIHDIPLPNTVEPLNNILVWEITKYWLGYDRHHAVCIWHVMWWRKVDLSGSVISFLFLLSLMRFSANCITFGGECRPIEQWRSHHIISKGKLETYVIVSLKMSLCINYARVSPLHH